MSQLQNRLATAAINAKRGEYEPARIAASDFYTDLRAEVDRAADGALNDSQRQRVAPMLTERDELITLLARGDPAAADRLAGLYLAYTQAINPSAPNPQ